MIDKQASMPDETAIRVALWRALHLLEDPAPHIIEDDIGMKLASPDEGWRYRPDMSLLQTGRARASIVARARVIEDLVIEMNEKGAGQYVILGAGLDSFAQRRHESVTHMNVFEIDRACHQNWKKKRLAEIGFGIPERLHFVPADFMTDDDWLSLLKNAGFDAGKTSVISSTGLSMYLTKDAVFSMMRQIATFASGSTLAMTFMPPLKLLEPEERPQRQATEKIAVINGTPFLSYYTPAEIQESAKKAGFSKMQYLSAEILKERYFTGRTDGLRPSSAEEMILASV
jgi:methyltransferase (TIGR00027 family)